MTKPLNDLEEKKLAERIVNAFTRPPFRLDKCSLTKTDLPFYKQGYKVRVKCFSTMPMITKEYICDDSHVFETDGEWETLKKINNELSLTLTAENIIPYAAFYFQNVDLDGSFAQLISSVQDFDDDEFSDELKANLTKLITSPKVSVKENMFNLSVFMLLNDTLFKSELSISETGKVSIDNKEIIYNSLPVRRTLLR